MTYIKQFLIIIAFSFIGEVLHKVLPLPIPASIYGIALLFVALEMKWVKVKDIREVSFFLVTIMPVMFIPAAVGLIDAWILVQDSWLTFVAVCVISTFVVMAGAGWATQWMIKRKEGKS
ncbi:MAG: CidA/LrgA family protein [Bacteroidales bacterium]|nr:CidA/LrgA family protein [Bacteroidales bacterium]